jgi:hypothetical protein
VAASSRFGGRIYYHLMCLVANEWQVSDVQLFTEVGTDERVKIAYHLKQILDTVNPSSSIQW